MKKIILFLRMVWIIITTVIGLALFILILPIEIFFLLIGITIGDYFKIKKITRFQYSH